MIILHASACVLFIFLQVMTCVSRYAQLRNFRIPIQCNLPFCSIGPSTKKLRPRPHLQLMCISSGCELGSDGSGGGGLRKSFISNIIEQDLKENKNGGKLRTRFPPEPNGYLHLGHAKSICLNFGIAANYGGVTNMRFDDTNPEKEDIEYVQAILDDVKWLVTDDHKSSIVPWDGEIRHTSDYFQLLADAAIYLIKQGKAYVDDLTADEMRELRGSLTEPGKNSPYRKRSIEENLELFRKMKDGEFPDGKCVLRAKIDMSSPNMNMRDPTLYRIKRAEHPMTGNKWVIYPM